MDYRKTVTGNSINVDFIANLIAEFSKQVYRRRDVVNDVLVAVSLSCIHLKFLIDNSSQYSFKIRLSRCSWLFVRNMYDHNRTNRRFSVRLINHNVISVAVRLIIVHLVSWSEPIQKLTTVSAHALRMASDHRTKRNKMNEKNRKISTIQLFRNLNFVHLSAERILIKIKLAENEHGVDCIALSPPSPSPFLSRDVYVSPFCVYVSRCVCKCKWMSMRMWVLVSASSAR